MLRFGNITEVDPANGYARVTFTDDGIVSDWLQFLTIGALKDKFSYTLEINEQVACVMDENSEEGVILGALFNDKSKPSGAGKGIFKMVFEDGSLISYNKNTHEYDLNIKGKINISGQSEININSESEVKINASTASVTTTANTDITSPVIKLNGAVAISGALTIGGTIGKIGGGAISGDLEVAGEVRGSSVKAGGIGLGTHKHSGVNTGTGTSGLPTP